MSDGVQTIYDARPKSVGSWSFEIREGDETGEIVAEVTIKGKWDEGEIRVGGIPFEVDRVGMSRAYRLVFESQTLAHAKPEGALGLSSTIAVEGALLASGVEVGDRVRFDLKPKGAFSSDMLFSLDGTEWGQITKEALMFRHFALRFNDAVPLALQCFCFALLLARMRRQARNG